MCRDTPDGPPFEGLTLRLFDPSAETWSIWWSSTRAPGPPRSHLSSGASPTAAGVFDCDDVLAGRPVKVRFEWLGRPTGRRSWQQSFSYDGGATWRLNWVMTSPRGLRRRDAPS